MDISQVPELVEKTAYPLIIDGYLAKPTVFTEIADVHPVTGTNLYGDKGSVLTTSDRPVVLEDNEEIPAGQFGSGPTWYCKIKTRATRMDIPRRMIDSSDSVGRITNFVAEQTARWGENFRLSKEDMVADVLQKGTLTAGSQEHFDGSFPGNEDPNKGFIYDGLPFFDTAHTLSVGGGTYSNHDADATLSTADLQAALSAMRVTNAVDERGNRVMISPDILLVPAGSQGWTARKLLNSGQLPGSANNDINTLQGELRLIEWAHLDDSASASAFWLGQAGMGLRVYDSGEPLIEMTEDKLRRRVSVTAYSYFGVTVTNWRGWYCGGKAAS